MRQPPEDPFRTLRSFHEKQRMERQEENTRHTSATSQSTLEGAVGGVGAHLPKPQRVTKKHHPQGQQYHNSPEGVTQSQPNGTFPNQQHVVNQVQQENVDPQQENFLHGPHNTTTYLSLPSSMQNKICG